jgi:RNA polymerase sigma factor (sigma-70 family)
VAELTRAVVLSDRAARELVRVRRAHSEHTRSHHREPTTLELADATGIDPTHVQRLLVADRHPHTLEEPVRTADGVHTPLREMLVDPHSEDEFAAVPVRVASNRLSHLLAGLDDRERRILRAHFGLDGPEQTLEQLGADLGLSGERVRQIKSAALAKLRGDV